MERDEEGRKMKKYLISSLPPLIFSLTILSLFFAGYGITKAIDVQNDFFLLIFTNLKKETSLRSFYQPLVYLLEEALIPSFLFFFLFSASIFILKKYEKEVDTRIFLASFFLSFSPVWIVSNFALPILTTSFGFVVASLLSLKLESGKFGKNYSIFSQSSRILIIFLALGILITLYMNYEDYADYIKSSNEKLLLSMLPSEEELWKIQMRESSLLFNKTADSLKNSLQQAYLNADKTYQEMCGAMYTALVSSLDKAKEDYVRKLRQENATFRMKDVLSRVPFSEEINATFPLFFCFLIISFLEIVKILPSLIFAFLLKFF